MRPRYWISACLAGTLVLAGWIGGCRRDETGRSDGATATAPSPGAAQTTPFTPPEVDVSKLPAVVQTKIGAARMAVRREGTNAVRVGELGAWYYVQGFPQAAAECFKGAAHLVPKEAAWWAFLGLAQERAGDPAAAAAAYDTALAVDAKCQLARVRGALLLIAKDQAQAAKTLRSILADDPRNLTAQLGLARCTQAAGQADEAITALRRVLAAAPDCAAAHEALAALYQAQGKTAEAERHTRRAAVSLGDAALADLLELPLLRQGSDVGALLVDLRMLTDSGDFTGAEEKLKTALDVAPDDLRVRAAAGALRYVQGRREEAITELRAVVERQPDFAAAASTLAQALADSGQPDEAERLLREVLERDPDHRVTAERFAGLMVRQGKLDAGLAFLETLAAAHPTEAALEFWIAQLLAVAQRAPEAVTHLRKAVELAPEYAAARHALGMILYSQGERAAARAEWEQVLERDSTFADAYLALAEAAVADKDPQTAQQILRKGLERTPDSPALLNGLAWNLATAADPQQRDGVQAVEMAQKACAATRGADPTYLDTLAAALAEAGRFDDAVRTIRQAMAVAESAGAASLVEKYRTRLALYEQRKPYHLAD